MKKLMLILSSILVMFAVQSCEKNPAGGDPTISIEDLKTDAEAKFVCFSIKTNQPQVKYTLTGPVESSIPAQAYEKGFNYKVNDLLDGEYTLKVDGLDAQGTETCSATQNFTIGGSGDNGDNNGDNNGGQDVNGDITIAADKTSGVTGETIHFSAKTSDGDVTGSVVFKDAQGFVIDKDYVIDFVGEQSFYAESGDNKSESIKITATMNKSEQYYKRNLILQFTATWCGYCPDMKKAIDEVVAGFTSEGEPDRVGIIAMHKEDEFVTNDHIRKTYNKIAHRFEVTGIPKAVIDFQKATGPTKAIIKARCEASSKEKPATVGIGIQTRFDSEGKLQIKANMRALEGGEYKICCAYAKNYGNYDHVFTQMFTAPLGDEIKLPANEYVTKTFTADITKDEAESCEIFVYILKSYDGFDYVNNMNSVIAGHSVSTRLK